MSISVPSINGNLKIEVSDASVDLNKLNEEYNDVYNYNGYGNLYAAAFKLKDEEIFFKLVIDDNTVCEVDIEILSEVSSFGSELAPMPLIYDSEKKILYLKFNNAIHYSSSLLFCFKKNSNSSKSKEMEGYQICLTKEGN